jgi:hypothetical protein
MQLSRPEIRRKYDSLQGTLSPKISYDNRSTSPIHQMGFLDYIKLPLSNLYSRLRLPTRFTRDLIVGLILGITLSLSSTSLASLAQAYRRKRAIAKIPPRPIELRSDEVVDGVVGLIGWLFIGGRKEKLIWNREYTVD